MKNWKRRGLPAMCAAVAVAALSLSGCTSAAPQSAVGGPTLTTYLGGSGTFVENFNPFSPTVLGETAGMLYEPLFAINELKPLDNPATPLLGTKYDWNAAGTQLSITTREGVKWSDGKPFTAADVAYTFNLKHDTPAFNTTGNAPTAKASDSTHVTLTFDRPSFADGATALGQTAIVPEHIWKKIADPTKFVNKTPVGTGPMTLSTFTSQSYLLKKNPDYWNASKVHVGGIRVLSLSGNQAATDRFLAGQLDWAGIFIPDIKKVLKNRSPLGYTLYGSQQVALAACSNAELGCTGPQTDPAVRQAIYYALNRGQVDKLAYYDNASAISPTFALLGRDKQFIAPQYAAAAPMTPDVAKAQSILEGAGYTKGSDGIYQKGGTKLAINVTVTSGYTDYIAALSAITEQLKTAGIEITTQQIALNEMLNQQGLGHFQMTITGLFQGPAPDPYYVYQNAFSTANTKPVGQSGNPYGNVSRFSDPVVDAQLTVAASSESPAVKAAAYAKIQRQIVPAMPYIPIINNTSGAEWSTKQVTGFPTSKDPYAQASPGAFPDNEIVLTHLKVK